MRTANASQAQRKHAQPTSVSACEAEGTRRDNGRWGPVLILRTRNNLPGEIEELCNGLTTLQRVDDVSATLGSETGACRRGTQVCANGVLACEGEVRPVGEVCDNEDNDCDGTTDEGLMPDFYESNETCPRAEILGPLPQETREALNVSATLYPDGDADWYTTIIEESATVSLTSRNDQDYEASVTLSNIPEDTEYQLCVSVAFNHDPLRRRNRGASTRFAAASAECRRKSEAPTNPSSLTT